MNFKIKDDYGREVVCNIVDIFKDESNNIKYVIYTDGSKSIDNKLKVYASRYEEVDGNYILKEIENDYEWNLIDNFLAKRKENLV